MTAKDVEDYLRNLPGSQQAVLENMRQSIKALSPEITELISYGIPSFKYKGRQFMAFAAYPTHCNFLVMSYPIMDAYKRELKQFETDKATIRFMIDNPLPVSLIKKLVKARIAEIETKLSQNNKSRKSK